MSGNKIKLRLPRNSGAVYGQQPKAGGEWSERYCDEVAKLKEATPRKGDIVNALQKIYVRGAPAVWDDNFKDFIVGPIVGYVYAGDRIQILEVVDNNATNPNNKNAWYWVRLNRLPKK